MFSKNGFLFAAGGGGIVLAAALALWDKQEVTADVMQAEHRVARAQFNDEFSQVMRTKSHEDANKEELEAARAALKAAREAAALKTADANRRLSELPGGEGAGGPAAAPPQTAEEAIAQFK